MNKKDNNNNNVNRTSISFRPKLNAIQPIIPISSQDLYQKKKRIGRDSVPNIKVPFLNDEIPEGKKSAKILNLQFNYSRDISLGTSIRKDFNENNLSNYSRTSIDCLSLPNNSKNKISSHIIIKK